MKKLTTVDETMLAIDAQLKVKNIPRSATRKFPGVRSGVMTNYFAGHTSRIQLDTLFALLEGAGLELWVRRVPSTTRERRKYNAEMAPFLGLAELAAGDGEDGSEGDSATPAEDAAQAADLLSVRQA